MKCEPQQPLPTSCSTYFASFTLFSISCCHQTLAPTVNQLQIKLKQKWKAKQAKLHKELMPQHLQDTLQHSFSARNSKTGHIYKARIMVGGQQNKAEGLEEQGERERKVGQKGQCTSEEREGDAERRR